MCFIINVCSPSSGQEKQVHVSIALTVLLGTVAKQFAISVKTKQMTT
jgi:hypothetical protein